MFTSEELANIIQGLHESPTKLGNALQFMPTYHKLLNMFQQVKSGERRVALITQEEHDLIKDFRAASTTDNEVAPPA